MSKTQNVEIKRCGWVNNDPIYIEYHDKEWGTPQYDGIKLFEMLCLEGQQAGLSWITILKKRDNYRNLFYNFNPHRIQHFEDSEVEKLLHHSGIVRHKGKIQAIINNAKCYIDMENNGENFSHFVWKFVNNKPIINSWKSTSEIPSETEISLSLSKCLKKKGFKYVGSTICYAFMQASGLVNDHINECICRVGLM